MDKIGATSSRSFQNNVQPKQDVTPSSVRMCLGFGVSVETSIAVSPKMRDGVVSKSELLVDFLDPLTHSFGALTFRIRVASSSGQVWKDHFRFDAI